MGLVLADHADRADASDQRSRSRRRQARVRCDDDDEKDRHRHHRSRAPRLTSAKGDISRRQKGDISNLSWGEKGDISNYSEIRNVEMSPFRKPFSETLCEN